MCFFFWFKVTLYSGFFALRKPQWNNPHLLIVLNKCIQLMAQTIKGKKAGHTRWLNLTYLGIKPKTNHNVTKVENSDEMKPILPVHVLQAQFILNMDQSVAKGKLIGVFTLPLCIPVTLRAKWFFRTTTMEEFGGIWHRREDLSRSFCGCHYQNFLEKPVGKKTKQKIPNHTMIHFNQK